jgi:hypothetical protein
VLKEGSFSDKLIEGVLEELGARLAAVEAKVEVVGAEVEVVGAKVEVVEAKVEVMEVRMQLVERILENNASEKSCIANKQGWIARRYVPCSVCADRGQVLR